MERNIEEVKNVKDFMRDIRRLREIETLVFQYICRNSDKERYRLNTPSRMKQKDALKEGQVNYNRIKKALDYLEKNGLIYKRSAEGSGVNYYSSISPQTCKEKGSSGIPNNLKKFIKNHQEFLIKYYTNRSIFYTSLSGYYDKLREKIQLEIKKELSDNEFILVLNERYFSNNPLSKASKELKFLSINEIEAISKIIKEYEVPFGTPFSLFLFELLIVLMDYCSGISAEIGRQEVKCNRCKKKLKCLTESRKDLNEFMQPFMEYADRSKIKEIWKKILEETEIDETNILSSIRFLNTNINKQLFELKNLVSYGGNIEFFYSKIIPNAINSMVEDYILPELKENSKLLKELKKSR